MGPSRIGQNLIAGSGNAAHERAKYFGREYSLHQVECQTKLSSVPRVAIMVLNFNGKVLLQRCLSSLLKLEYPSLEIHLIDNGSSDGSADYVRSAFPMVSVTAYPENLGYAEGYDIAIRNVKADYVLLLNNDTEVMSPRLVHNLIDALESHPEIAGASCKILFMADRSVINSIGGTGIRFWRGFADVGFGEKDGRQYDEPPVEPFSVCGAAALLRRDLYLSVGGFDRRFFAYSEDVDLCWRLRLRGYRMCYVPQARVLHHFSASLPPSSVNRLKLYWTRRNLLRMIIKNCAGSTLEWALRSVLAHLFAMFLWFSLTDPRSAICLARAVAWNLTNMNDTLTERRRIQLGRSVSESRILAVMYQPFSIQQGRQHPRLSRLAEILFGYNRRWRKDTPTSFQREYSSYCKRVAQIEDSMRNTGIRIGGSGAMTNPLSLGENAYQ